MRNATLLLPALFLFSCTLVKQSASDSKTFKNARQLVVVTSPDDRSTGAKLAYFNQTKNGWEQVAGNIDAMLGRTGLAWGRGLHAPQTGRLKQEGDGKSPAGIFTFGTAFGYLPTVEISWKIPYLQVTGSLECVDDSKSKFYNRLVDNQEVGKDWNSSERMWEVGPQYDWGVFVNHNLPAEPQGGSCIFLHVWGGPGVATSGCTAMSEKDLLGLLQWLDPEKKPLLVQATKADYAVFQKKYALPGQP